MKSLIALATILTLTSCNPKPKETDVVSRVDCETNLVLDSKPSILRYSKTEYRSGYVKVSGSIQMPESQYVVMKTYKPGNSMGDLGHVTVKTDSEVFVSFKLLDNLLFRSSRTGDMTVVESDGVSLIVEYLTNNGLTAVRLRDYEACRETKGNK